MSRYVITLFSFVDNFGKDSNNERDVERLQKAYVILKAQERLKNF